MAEIPRRYIDNYTKALNKISADVQDKLGKALAKVDLTDVGAARDAIIDIMELHLGPYTDMAAVLAAEFYDGLREQAVGAKLGAYAESGREPIATERAVRGIMQDVVEGKASEVVVGKLTSRADYEIKRAAGECIYRNGQRDPLKPRYARVPSGGETCRFCIMLASRGFVYHSKESAGENGHYHANCDCRIVPGFGGETTVPGYDPDVYYDMWRHPEKYSGNKSIQVDDVETEPVIDGAYVPSFTKRTTKTDAYNALYDTNPNFGKGKPYQINCQRCVAVYEARRRGYDVIAKPRDINDRNDRLPYMNDPKGWPHIFDNPNLVKCASNSGLGTKAKVEKEMASYGNGARAIVRVQWQGTRSGHVFIAEQRGSKTVFMDPQNGKTDCSDYFSRAKKNATFCMRIDNLDFTDLIEQAAEEV